MDARSSRVSEELEAIDRLKRIAFGPDATPEERAAAEEALRELDAQERAATVAANLESEPEPQHPGDAGYSRDEFSELLGEADSDEDADARGGDGDGDGVIQHYAEELSLWRRRIRIGWLAPVVVGSLLLGTLGALGSTGQLDPVASPTPQAEQGSEVVSGDSEWLFAGDIQLADSWFYAPFTPADAFPDPQVLESNGIDAENVRSTSIGGIWIGRTDKNLCLLYAGSDSKGTAECIYRDQFVARGLSLDANDAMFQWLGGTIIVTMFHTGSIGSGSSVSVPEQGPGDVGAATSFFSRTATAEDAFPDSEMLGRLGFDQSQVRLIFTNGGQSLWLAQEGTAGFCFLSFDKPTEVSQKSCATIAEFEKFGVIIFTPTMISWWGGAGVETNVTQ